MQCPLKLFTEARHYGWIGVAGLTRRLASLALVLLFAMTLSAPCVAAQDTVSGKVTGVGGEPLRANVSTVANNQIVKTVTASTDGSWTLPLDPGVSKVLVYLDDPSTPGYDYVPALIGVSEGPVEIVLLPAASLHMEGDLLFVDTDNIPVSYSYQVSGVNGTLLSPSGYPLVFGSKTTNSIPVPNLPAATVIVPAGAEYRVWIGASILVGTKVTTKAASSVVQQPLGAGTLTEFPVMGVTLEYNLGLVASAISDASARILSMEGQGFYLVREKGILARAVAGYEAAQQRYEEGDFAAGFDSAKRSYIDARSTLGELSNLALDATSSVYIIIGFLALASVTAGFLLVDSTRLQIALGAVVYVASLLLLGKVYPGVGATPLQGLLLTSAASYVVVVAAAVFIPRLIGGGGGNGRVSVGGVLVPVFSIAKRSLKEA